MSPARHERTLAEGAAPHVHRRGGLRSVTGAFLVALLPCVGFGLYGTGLQIELALAEHGGGLTPGWRGSLFERFGLAHDAESLAACTVLGALHMLPLLLVCLATGAFWERLFARLRHRDRLPGLALFATLFTLCLPPTLPLWQAALGFSFGLVMGKEVFGGLGRYVVHPVLVGLAFLYTAWPDAVTAAAVHLPVEGLDLPSDLELAASGGLAAITARGVTWGQSFLGTVPGNLGEASALACLCGAAILLVARAASWRILAGALLGTFFATRFFAWTSGATVPAASLPWHWHLVLGSSAFALVFLATDPVTSATTQAGRWIQGLAVGSLIVLIRVASPAHADGAALALLLGNVFVPVIDHAVVQIHVARRARRLRAAGGHG